MDSGMPVKSRRYSCSLSELIRENDVSGNFTHIYTYDARGNLIGITENATASGFSGDLAKVNSIEKVGDATKSTASAGRTIHKGYKTGYKRIEDMTKEAVKGKNRLDFLDDVHKIIYELKPNNPREIKNGIQQLQRYNRALGGGYSLILEIY